MIVVSDTSPILNLAAIGHLWLLQELYGELLMPPAVAEELLRNGWDVSGVSWLTVRRATDAERIDRLRRYLDPGEAEAISLALELNAELLLMDERRGRAVGSREGLVLVGVLGVLGVAKQKGLIPLCAPLLKSLRREVDFWMSADLERRFLASVGEAG